jgi:hypothetical protein
MNWPENAVHQNDWKLYYNFRNDSTELYNIERDRFERNNIAAENLKKVEEILKLLNE